MRSLYGEGTGSIIAEERSDPFRGACVSHGSMDAVESRLGRWLTPYLREGHSATRLLRQ